MTEGLTRIDATAEILRRLAQRRFFLREPSAPSSRPGRHYGLTRMFQVFCELEGTPRGDLPGDRGRRCLAGSGPPRCADLPARHFGMSPHEIDRMIATGLMLATTSAHPFRTRRPRPRRRSIDSSARVVTLSPPDEPGRRVGQAAADEPAARSSSARHAQEEQRVRRSSRSAGWRSRRSRSDSTWPRKKSRRATGRIPRGRAQAAGRSPCRCWSAGRKSTPSRFGPPS